MSKQLVSRSPDLQHLQDDGYDLDIVADQLLIKHVPYVTATKSVAYGTLVSDLTTAGDVTAAPGTHEIWFVGEIPCDSTGAELTKIINQRGSFPLGSGLTACCSFSSKPPEGYPDYFEKMTSYVAMLDGHARAIDATATARTYPPIAMTEEESPFRYGDAAASRSRIGAVTEKLKLAKVVIIGLGGTGSYILDLVAKTPVARIDIYDCDLVFTHNAFRSPGAASLDELRARPHKVDHLHAKYDPMHRNIHPHAAHLDGSNVDELRDATFVFIAVDHGPAKKLIIKKLEEFGVPFVDVGMGIYQTGDSLGGLVRTTASTEGQRAHIWDMKRISFADEDDDEYDQNIQIADLNMLNAALAVIRWKKLFGFYLDFEHEHSSTYTIDGNHLLNEDQAE